MTKDEDEGVRVRTSVRKIKSRSYNVILKGCGISV